MDHIPEVSIVIAAKDEGLYVQEAVKSILGQDDVALELIFVDDGSTDNTYEIVQNIAAGDSRVRLLRNPARGKCSAFNFGVEASSGMYICIFAGDDIMPAGSLRSRLDIVRNIPGEYAIGLSKIRSFSHISQYDDMIIPRRPGVASLSGVSPLMSRRAASRIFPVPSILPNEDTWMELCILYLPDLNVRHTDVICCHWRVHQGNSVNFMSEFSTYSKKIQVRMAALSIFREQHGHALPTEALSRLNSRIDCEDARRSGRILGVLTSGVSLRDALRALASTNRFFYAMRAKAYRIFSGWG